MESTESPLTIIERARASLQLGESHFREFKSALVGEPSAKAPRNPRDIRLDIGEALVAFANADGGELLVGVEDDATVSGVPHGEQVVASLLQAWKTHVHKDTPLPPPRLARISLDGHLVLYFAVEKGTEYIHLTQNGRCLQRRDRESVPVPTEHIHFERQERLSRQYDRAFIDGADPSVLDLEAVERVADEVAPGLSPEKVLQLLDLAEFGPTGVRIRRAGLLLLAKEIGHWHPRCEVRILRVSGNELRSGRDYNIATDKHVSGSILDLLSRSWEELRPYLVETRLGPDGRFEEQVRYPEDACREALTNAIAHRDYSIEGRAIEVYVFDDRLEVRSPGALLSTVTIEGIRSLHGVHQSRNTIVARSLRELGYMREMGEGFRRIFQLMRAHDLVEPDLFADEQSFVVSLQHRSVFSEEDQRWIGAFEVFDLERREERALLLGRQGQPLSVRQIMDALDLVDTEDYRVLILGLQQKGLIRGINRGTGKRTRNEPRWMVVQPKDANRYFGELLKGAQAIFAGAAFQGRDFTKIAAYLSPDSPYNPQQGLGADFRRLGLTDNSGNPTGRLLAVLKAGGFAGNATRPSSPSTAKSSPPPTSVTTKQEEAEFDFDEEGLDREPKKLFVDNLNNSTRASAIREMFNRVGEVRRVSLPRDMYRSERNRGYAFVEMGTSLEAKRARRELEGSDLDGQPIRMEWAKV